MKYQFYIHITQKKSKLLIEIFQSNKFIGTIELDKKKTFSNEYLKKDIPHKKIRKKFFI